MKKFFVFVFLIALAIFLSGLYGIIHDQFTYTISSEYFTKFKFQQFGVAEMNLPDRARVSMVGFLASWWMGIPIGLLVGGSGFIHRDYRRMLKISLLAFGLVIFTTLSFGLCGLLYGYPRANTTNLANYNGWFIPKDVVHLRRFLCVGNMHNAMYLGGTLSIFIACFFQVFFKIRDAIR
jgi:hypothetical protein